MYAFGNENRWSNENNDFWEFALPLQRKHGIYHFFNENLWVLNRKPKFSHWKSECFNENLILYCKIVIFDWKHYYVSLTNIVFQCKIMIFHEKSNCAMKNNDLKSWIFMKIIVKNEKLVAWKYSWLCIRNYHPCLGPGSYWGGTSMGCP